MPGTMFGAPEGIIAFDQNELVKARTAQELAQAASYPSIIRLHNAQAQKLEDDNKQGALLSQLMIQAMGEQGTGAPATESPFGAFASGEAERARPSLADSLEKIAGMAARAGLPSRAESLAKSAAAVRVREANAQNAQARARLNILRGMREDAELTSQVLADAKDEPSWRQANALYQFQTGRVSPYSNLPYSPELVERLKSAALSVKERADLEEKRLTREGTEDYRKKRLGQIDTQNEIRKAAQRTREDREDRLAKAGGGRSVSSPAKAEIDQAARLIGKDYSSLSSADKNDAAYSIAAEAKALRRANPALDANMALQQAYNNAVASGDFGKEDVYGGLKTRDVYSGRGKSPLSPAPMPTAEKDLKVDRYYVNRNGQIGQWTGKGFLVSGRPLSGNNSRVSLPPDTEDDDEED